MNRSRIAIGSFVGAALAGALAPLARGAFRVPGGGVGFVTVHHYPKSFDYFVIAMLAIGAFAGGVLASRRRPLDPPATRPPRFKTWPGALVVFVLMLFIHDHPYQPLEPFHDGEHLTPAFLFRDGARPFGDVFVLHGLAVDGGLDALVLGDPPSPHRSRRLQTLLDAATLALFVPIAAEICVTPLGAAAAVIATLSAIGAGWIPIFPYFRFLPLLLATLALLRGAPLLALGASSLGVLWSLDTGLYALTATAIVCIVLRSLSLKRAIAGAAIALLPIIALLILRADLHHFFADSFITIPHAIDAIWSLPMRTDLSWESARYFLPPVIFTMPLVFALRSGGDERRRLVIIAIVSLLAFRSAAGRCGWSHTRYGVPLIGIAIVAFIIEPLTLARRRVEAVIVAALLFVYAEVGPNVATAARFVVGWRARQSHSALVAYPLRTGKGIYTTPQNAADLAALNGFLPKGAPILDVSNERVLSYLLERKPATRCNDIAMLSSPVLFAEAMQQLEKNPPPVVIVSGAKEVDQFDALPNRERVPALFAWIDAHYPQRVQVGRFVVATK
jgi:hypothetical protein